MGDKNRVAETSAATDLLVKTGHGIIKSIYTSQTGDRIWTIRNGVAACAATGTVTFCTAVACDKVTVNGLVYNGVVGAKANDTEFSIDTSDCATATDFALSVTCDSRTGITIPAFDQTATSCTAVATITADIGQTGNQIDLSENTSGTIVVSGAFLTGGCGDPIITVDLVAATSGEISMPYINTPVDTGIFVDNTCAGAAGSLVIVFE